MGGKPSRQTPADMRLKENKAKYGTATNRDAMKQGGQPTPVTPTATNPPVSPATKATAKKGVQYGSDR